MKIFLISITILSTLLFSNVIDINSKEFKIKTIPNKIIVIGPGALRLVTIMNLQNKLVGIEKIERKSIKFSEYRTAIGKKLITSLPIIGAGGPGKLPNLEKIISLKPDIIISSFIDKKQLELIWQKTGIPILCLSYGLGYGGNEEKLKAIKKSFILMGKIFQKKQRAETIVNFMNTQEKELKKYKLKENNLYVGGMGFKGAHGITSSEKYYPSFELLGIKNNLTKNAKANHIFIQKESLLTQNPNVIFLDLFGKKIIKENLKSQPILYKSLSAYKNKKIYWLLPYNFYSTNISNVYINSWIILQRLGFNINIESKMAHIYNAFYKNSAKKLMKSRYPIMNF